MTENFEHDAHDYLLNQMEPARRAAFEQELQRNPEAKVALKAQADSLAGFACEVAGTEPLGAADHRAVLGAIVAATRSPDQGRSLSPPRRAGWGRFFWPAAATILLVLNLVEFDRPLVPRVGPGSTTPDERKPPSIESSNSRGATASDPFGDTTVRQAPPPGAPTQNVGATTQEDRLKELERLRASVAELQRAQQKLRAEYDAVINRVAERAVIDKELNRLTTMELVDASSYARGERKGLVNVGRGILTEPGVVTATDSGPPPLATTLPPPKPAYAWSVFDEKEHRGYLNLYNLPTLVGDQSMQVWVKPVDVTEFQRVGEVPQQFHGRNGSVQYTLPGTASTPAEILITIEPRSAVPIAPSGPTVLKGP
jgi:hypothetical protein